MSQGTIPTDYYLVGDDGRFDRIDGEVIEEVYYSIHVNVRPLATVMITPVDREAFAVGFLANEEIINSPDDLLLMHPWPNGGGVDIWVNKTDFTPARQLILTSGCGGGVTFNMLSERQKPINSGLRAEPKQMLALLLQLYEQAELYKRSRGVHTSGLGRDGELYLVAEDVGRHNTLDKLAGKALLSGIDTRDSILVTTGRISSEMLNKARRMGVPIVGSRTSPTSLSVQLARAWNITVVGYIRKHGLRVYTHPWRLGLGEPAKATN